MMGYSLAELRELLRDVTHPTTSRSTRLHLRGRRRREIQVFEKRYIRRTAPPSGPAQRHLIRDEEGWPTNTIAIVEDITAQKRAIEGGARARC